MIKELTLKQKIILGICIAIVSIAIILVVIYICTMQNENAGEDMSEILLEDMENATSNEILENGKSETGLENENNGKEQENSNSNKLKDENNANFQSGSGIDNDENQINSGFDIPEDQRIVVHIMGEVNKKGIIYLKNGARIADAIAAAGGATKEADIDAINLAYVLEDGQKINIPNKKDREKNGNNVYITSESGNNVITQQNSNQKGVNKKVNINEASQSDLETLPGIGPSIASRIIEYRTQNGKFSKIEDLQNVKGIGDAKYNGIKDQITVK